MDIRGLFTFLIVLERVSWLTYEVTLFDCISLKSAWVDMWLDLKEKKNPQNIMILPEMGCWFNILLYSTVYLAKNHYSGVCGNLSQTLCKPRVVLWCGHGSLVLVFSGMSKPWRAGQCLLSSVWNAVSTKKVHYDPKSDFCFQSSLYSILYSHIKLIPTHHPITTTCNIVTLTAWILGVWKLFTYTIITQVLAVNFSSLAQYIRKLKWNAIIILNCHISKHSFVCWRWVLSNSVTCYSE